MTTAVTRQKGDVGAIQSPDDNPIAGGAEWGPYLYLLDIRQSVHLVQAGAADERRALR